MSLLIMGLNTIFCGWLFKKTASAGHGTTRTSEPMRILPSDERPKQIPMGHGWHDTYGWLRRDDLDESYDGFMYETPDGHLVRSVDARHQKGMYLDKYIVEDTGENIFQISSIPKVYSHRRNQRDKA
jgi:hypothetical protein